MTMRIDDADELRPPRTETGKPGSRATIFLADDDDLFRRVLGEELVARGYEVIEASDGAAALERLAMAADGQCPVPDVLVLDVRMPGLSGLGVLELMRRFPERPTTLLVTGFTDRSLHLFASRFGVQRILHKPVDLDEVLDAVLHAAQMRRQPRPTW